MRVQVAYMGREGTVLVEVDLGEGASVADAIAASGIVTRLGLFEAALSYAIHGQRAERNTPVRPGDRVELLRPLLADAKEVRRKRASDHPLPRLAKRPGGRR